MNGVVEVRSGRIRGVHRQGHWSYSGVPYAGSPAGAHRWRPPARPAGWTGIRECDHFGPIAPQSPGFFEQSLSGEPEERAEDCLTLNIWTPAPDGARRPVMVWIHGGSFVSGSGSGRLYRGGMLAEEGDVVVVTLNYRLGLLGFLAHPALAEPDQTWLDGQEWTGFGNWGLADQVAALWWVRDHIASFGGDPGNVTLFGESAGGMSVSSLLAVPSARGLFHRAVVESGPPHAFPGDRAAARAEQVAARLGVPLTRAALEEVPAEVLVKVAVDLGAEVAARDDPALLVLPVVDGGLLPGDPVDAVSGGSVSQVPLLIGTTRDESSFFVVGDATLRALDEDGLQRWTRRLSPDVGAVDRLVTSVRGVRAGRGEPVTPRDLWVAIATEYVFRLPSIRLADAHARGAGSGVGTYCYLFTWESPVFGGSLGSCHALDLPFVFGTVVDPAIQTFCGGGDDALALSALVRGAWTTFARTGSPDGRPAGLADGAGGAGRADGAGGAGLWPGWDPVGRPTTILGPWPGDEGLVHRVDRPRDEELEAMAALVAGRPVR